MEENFFLLGGHSLLGAQLLARVNDVFGVAIPLRTLFDIPTISGLSAEIERLVLTKLEAMTEEAAEGLLLG
jgi:acyl carrier protein